MKLNILAVATLALTASVQAASAQCVDCALYPDRDHLNGGVLTPAGKMGLQRAYGAAAPSKPTDGLAGVRDQYLQALDTSVAKQQKKRMSHQ
jgi:hypothetical protein